MSDGGWVKIHRKMTEWEWFTDVNVAHLFLYCLLAANHEPKRWRGVTIERGQFVTSRDHLAEATGLSVQQVRTALDKLERTGEITQKSTNKSRIVTICKYSNYQVVDDSEQPTINQQITNNQPTINQQITNNQPTINQQITTTEEYKNIRNKEDIVEEVDVERAHAHTHEGEGGGDSVIVRDTEVLWREFREIFGQESEQGNSIMRYFKNKSGYTLGRDELVSLADNFQEQNRILGKSLSTTSDYKLHFFNWLRIQIDEKIKNQRYDQRSNDNQRNAGRSTTADITRPDGGDEFRI